MEAPVTFRPLAVTIPEITSNLTLADYWGAFKVRWNIGRDHYSLKPGLYKIGNPDQLSDVFVSANYKLSFDILRKNLKDLNAWILTIDTKGINVWCAAGKGTFGTDNLVRSIREAHLEDLVKHRRIILPQLGAPGVAAHIVKELTGFKVLYGPVRAKDIHSFIQAGYKATPLMRRVTFSFADRAKLIPVDLVQGTYRLLTAFVVLFILSGLDRTGFLFGKMWQNSLVPFLYLAGAYIAGVAIAPLFLPYVPFRAFALKGAFWGMVSTIMVTAFFKIPILEVIAMGCIGVSIASFLTMNFTGSSTFTSLSGVKKEMQLALPLQIAIASGGIILFIISKLI